MHEVGSLRSRMSLMVCLCTRSSTSNIITTTCSYYHPSSLFCFVLVEEHMHGTSHRNTSHRNTLFRKGWLKAKALTWSHANFEVKSHEYPD